MPIRSELPDRRAGDRLSAVLRGLLVAVALLATAVPALGQPTPAPPPPAPIAAPAPADAELAAELAETYRLLPSRDGVLLVPREEVPGVQTIEVAGGEVIVNGEPVAETILRSWFGAEAEPLLALAALDPAAARALVTPGAPGETGEAEDGEGDPAAELPEPPAVPEAPEVPGRTRVNLGGKYAVGQSVEIRADETASEVVVMGGGAHVVGRVEGDLVVIGGNARVEGEVGGEVVAVGGTVELGPAAHVHRDVTAVGGGVRRADGARVDGTIEEVSAAPWAWRGQTDDWRPGSPFRAWRVQEAVWHLLWVVTLGLLVLLILLVARRTTEGAATRVGADFGDLLLSALVGILGLVLFVFFVLPALGMVFLLLVLTIVGCLVVPLVAVAVPVIVVAVLLVGYAAVALRVGRWVSGRIGKVPPGVFAPAIIGVLVIQVWALAGESLQVLGGPAATIAVVFLIFGYTLEALVWLIGLGALLRHLFGGGRRPGLAAGAPPYGTLPAGPPPAVAPGTPIPPPTATPGTPPPAAHSAGAAAPVSPDVTPSGTATGEPLPPPPTAPEPPERESAATEAEGTDRNPAS
ncbi:MAG TPA: hypothetical protein VHQ65_15805 [Thermoanaerobaculia bacterium]|nr:hypothetical protein [Thermoanaerobaculia bacterium]